MKCCNKMCKFKGH